MTPCERKARHDESAIRISDRPEAPSSGRFHEDTTKGKTRNMKRRIAAALVGLVIAGAPTYAAPPEGINLKEYLKDYDDDLMRDLERTIKFFEPDISGENAEGATDDAGVLRNGFKYTEDYFAKKGNAADAVKISRDGVAAIDAALQAINAKNFDKAAELARDVSATCRACHDIYKPKQPRS
jgi:hypothetical protein